VWIILRLAKPCGPATRLGVALSGFGIPMSCPVTHFTRSQANAHRSKEGFRPTKKPALGAGLAMSNDQQTTTNDVGSCQVDSRLANPSRSAYNAAWVRLARCSLPKILPTWVRTVRSLMLNRSAIS
jgi:hypothetical protein